MPALVIPSPLLLDQTFPRNDDELRRAAVALGRLSQLIQTGEVVVGLTADFKEIAVGYDATKWGAMPPLQRAIRVLMGQLYLRGAGTMDLAFEDTSAPAHPIPAGVHLDVQGYNDFWALDLGMLLEAHAACPTNGRYCLCAGVACDYAFAGMAKGSYIEPFDRAFMLVGPGDIIVLSNVYEWDVPHDAHQLAITVSDLESNFRAIGATWCSFGGKHPEIRFPNGSKWSYSRNWRPQINDKELKQLIPLTRLPLSAIKWALSTGNVPLQVRVRACLDVNGVGAQGL